jgi:hypothetical protein
MANPFETRAGGAGTTLGPNTTLGNAAQPILQRNHWSAFALLSADYGLALEGIQTVAPQRVSSIEQSRFPIKAKC